MQTWKLFWGTLMCSPNRKTHIDMYISYRNAAKSVSNSTCQLSPVGHCAEVATHAGSLSHVAETKLFLLPVCEIGVFRGSFSDSVCGICDVHTACVANSPINQLLGSSETSAFLCNSTIPSSVATSNSSRRHCYLLECLQIRQASTSLQSLPTMHQGVFKTLTCPLQ